MRNIIKMLALDHPLIDVIARVEKFYLDRYNLPLNATVKPIPKLMPIYKEITSMSTCQTMPAGSAMNTLRGCQHVISRNYPNSTWFFGCIGDDDYGKILLDDMKKHGMVGCMHVHKEYPTGRCAVLLCNEHRLLMPNLGAACNYPDTHIKENWDKIEDAETYYSTSYFLSTNPKSLRAVFNYGAEAGKPVYFNLAAKDWVLNYSKPLMELFPTMEGIIGNIEEGYAFGKLLGYEDPKSDMKDIIAAMCKATLKNKREKRWVVITNSLQPTMIGIRDEKGNADVFEIQTPQVAKELVLTTNGAGDMLAGGMLGSMIAGHEILDSFSMAQQLVRYYIQQPDGSLPKEFFDLLP